MEIQIITASNEAELNRKLAKRPFEYSPIKVSVRGRHLTKTALEQVEKIVQDVFASAQRDHALAAELPKDIHAALLVGSSDAVVSLADLNLPQNQRQRIEAQIHAKLSQLPYPLSAGRDSTCICAGDIPGWTMTPQENCLEAPPGEEFLVFVVIRDMWGRVDSTDKLTVVTEDGARFNLGPLQMAIGLATAVEWAKEIVAWSLCRGRLSSVYQGGPSSEPNYMLLENECGGADSIVFRKPRFLGVWNDLFHMDHTLFWDCWGGKIITFTWLDDRP